MAPTTSIATFNILPSAGQEVLPVVRISNRLFFIEDVQPRVLAACRRHGIRFDLLTARLQTPRYALVLILRGCDPVPPALRQLLDDFVLRAESLPPARSPRPVRAARLASGEAI